MFVSNSYLNLPNNETDLGRYPNFSDENEFISNLMLNPQKYREFKSNINRINNIDNEINYLKSLEKNTQINFLDNITITEEEFQEALKDEEVIFESLNEDRINDLLSHKKLLSHEKHLIETMAYILGYESFDWNMLRRIINLYNLKTKMQNVDYSRIKKKRINLLLSQLCRSNKFSRFLKMNDFCDSGLEFIYEWVKTQLKIFFYLYQNKKINKLQTSKSMINIMNQNNNNNNNDNKTDDIYIEKKFIKNKKTKENNKKLSEENYYKNINRTADSNLDDKYTKTKINKRTSLNEKEKEKDKDKTTNNNNTHQKYEKMDNLFFKNTTNIDTFNNNNNLSNLTGTRSTVINSNNYFINRSSNINHMSNMVRNKSNLLLTSLPYIVNKTNSLQTNDQSTSANSIQKNNYKGGYIKEARKVSFKLKGFNKIKENILKEIKTAEMLPFLKNKTFPQMRNYFDDKLPFDKRIEQRLKKDIDYLSINGSKDEKKMLSIIARGKMKSFNLESLYKLRYVLQN